MLRLEVGGELKGLLWGSAWEDIDGGERVLGETDSARLLVAMIVVRVESCLSFHSLAI